MSHLLRLSLLCLAATLASADGLDAEFDRGPCPALVARVRVWVARLGERPDSAEKQRLHRRLLQSGDAGAEEMAARLLPVHAEMKAAEKAGKSEEAGARLDQLLDLLDLLGEGRSPAALGALLAAAQAADWTEALRLRAVVALGRLGDHRSLKALVALRTVPALEYEAGRAILAIEHFDAVPYWVELLGAGRQELVTRAHDLLRKWSRERYDRERAVWARYLRDYPEGFKRMPGYVEK